MDVRRQATTLSVAAALTLGPALAGIATAQGPAPEVEQEAEQQMQQAEPGAMAQAGLSKASELIGQSITDEQGAEVATLSTLAVDVTNGRVAYAIVSDAQLDSGNTFAAVPWQALRVSGDQLTLAASADQLRQSEGFNRGEEPDMADAQWAQQQFQQFGLQPYWEAGGAPQIQQQGQTGEPQGETGQQHMGQDEVDTERVQQILQQGMEQRGVDPDTASEAAEQLAQHHAQQKLRQQQLSQRIAEKLEGAGVESEQAEQAGQQLAQRIVQATPELAQAGAARAQQDQQPTEVVQFSELDGREVRNFEDQQLGEISDLVIDAREGRIAYAVISHGGFIGIGQKLSAVPWRALEHQPDQQRFALDTDAETIEQLAFSRNDWPDMASEQWANQTHSAFNQQPYWQVYGYAAPGAQQMSRDQAVDLLTRRMEALGVPSDAAQQEAERLVQEYEQRRLEQQELSQRIQSALENAGVESQQAQQAADELSRRIVAGQATGAIPQGQIDPAQVQQTLQQGMEEAGVESDAAEQAAQQLAQEHAQQQYAQDQLASRIQTRLEEAGVETGQAEQKAQELAQRIIESAQRQQQQQPQETPGGESY